MFLCHATPRVNLPSIALEGLLPTRSKTARQEVWIHHHRHCDWAMRHVAQRHKVDLDDVALLYVFVPKAWLTVRASGLWVVKQVIEPERLRGQMLHDELKVRQFERLGQHVPF